MKLPPEELANINRGLKKLGLKKLNDYYQTEEWQRTKRLKTNGNEYCYVCSTEESLQLHHETYENLGEEYGHELIWLCQKCHTEIHQEIEALLDDGTPLMKLARAILYLKWKNEDLERTLDESLSEK